VNAGGGAGYGGSTGMAVRDGLRVAFSGCSSIFGSIIDGVLGCSSSGFGSGGGISNWYDLAPGCGGGGTMIGRGGMGGSGGKVTGFALEDEVDGSGAGGLKDLDFGWRGLGAGAG
jgi:hypothetical protein